VARGIEEFCTQVRRGLANATFEQRRVLVELLIDRVIVTDEDVEVRYVVPTSPTPPHQPFCQLRTDYLHRLPGREVLRQEAPGNAAAEHLEDAVHHLSEVHSTGMVPRLGRWDQRLQDSPLPVGQVTGVSLPPAPWHSPHFTIPTSMIPTFQTSFNTTVPLFVSCGDDGGMLGPSSGAGASNGTSQRFALEVVSRPIRGVPRVAGFPGW
jgi:hypothetical protein